MKIIRSVFFLFFLFLFSFFFLKIAFAGKNLIYSILDNRPDKFEENYYLFKKNLDLFLPDGEIKALISFLPEILGETEEKIYYVILQNNKELRPSGGFMGSFAKLKFAGGGLSNMEIQDIYVPDGQLPGHVQPPWPIQQAFKQGWWKLRDANWDPDFPATAQTIAWFLERGGEEKADGIIAVNLSLFEKILPKVGSMKLINYNQVVNKDNFYQIIQGYSETNFFPGSTQKKDILSEFAKVFFEKVKSLNLIKKAKILKIILASIEQKQTLFYFQEREWQNIIWRKGWDGSLADVREIKEGEYADYLYIVETNLGANKANCCVDREVVHNVFRTDSGLIEEELKIEFLNKSTVSTPQPPVYWGGNYINFLRVYLPESAVIKKITAGGEEIPKESISYDFKEKEKLLGVGFFVTIPFSSQKTVRINYFLPAEPVGKYRLIVKRQPGIESFKYQLILAGENIRSKKITKIIFKDHDFRIKL